MQDCLKQTVMRGLNILGGQGGVIFVNDTALDTYYGNISYGYYEGEDKLASIGSMEDELSEFVGLALPRCTDFSIFKEFNVSVDEISVSTQIIWNEVIVTVEYPLEVSTPSYEGSIDRFIYHAPVRLGRLHDVAKSLVNKSLNDPDNIDLSYLITFEDVGVSFIPVTDADLVYTITDSGSSLDGLPYLFMFANKFVVNQAPVITIEDVYYIEEDTAFLLDLNVTDPEDDDLLYYDDTALFDITEDGIIAFPAEIPGEYDAVIRVEDSHYNYDEVNVKFIVR